MDSSAQTPFQKLLTEVVKKNIIIFGPSIVFAKLKHIPQITVDAEGNVTKINGNPHIITQQFITEFMQLSSFVAKKTLQPLVDQDLLSNTQHTEGKPV